MMFSIKQFFTLALALVAGSGFALATGADEPAITLNALVDEALAQNPLLQSARRGVDAKKFLIVPAATLPEPTASFQTMGNLIPPTLQQGDPSSGRNFSFTQEIPFPGKLRLQGRIASMEAEAEGWNYEQVRRQLISDVKVAYYDHWLTSKSLEIVSKDKDLLEKLAQIAETKYQVGEGIQQDVVKAQVEVSKLLDRSIVLQQRESISLAQINVLLYRSPETPLGRTAEVTESPLDLALEDLYRLAIRNSPMLKMQERMIDRNQFGVQLARKSFYPDFEVGFTYVNRTDSPEMFGLTVGARIPIYFWRKQGPELAAAAATLSSARKRYDWLHSRVFFELKDLYLSLTTSKKLMDLYRNGIIPQGAVALESATAGYQVGRIDFLTLVDNLVTLLDYELKYYEALSDHQKTLVRLEAMVGAELAR